MNTTTLDTNTLIIIVLVVLVLALAGALFWQRRRSDQLKSRFGPEYARTIRETGDKRKAEAELQERARRVEKLSIRPLPPAEREQFTADWQRVQAEFVDDPEGAIDRADLLLQDVMSARGYPVSTFEQVAADVSVDHPGVVQHYRAGHEIAVRQRRGEAGTEDLRQAMIHYRELFEELVTDEGPAERGSASPSGRRSDDSERRPAR
jgi:hypothetical protein